MSQFRTIEANGMATGPLHQLMLSAVIPRPIAFASTIDANGNVNLSPFSFFNCFGSNPPLLIFSPSTRVRDNTRKHTLENVLEIPEVVVGIVNQSMAEQMSLASCEYPKGVDEFVKSGLTPVASLGIRPPRVEECPVSFECRVMQVIHTGEQGGAGNLVLCEILRIHVNEEILDHEGKIDPLKLDPIARLGGNYYSCLTPESLFEIRKPVTETGIGVDSLPSWLRFPRKLTGNELGMLGNVHKLPEKSAVLSWSLYETIGKEFANLLEAERAEVKIKHIKSFLAQGKVEEAWYVILM